jgi:hypothetical protein
MLDHKQYLRLYCRVCGRRAIADDPNQTLHPIEHLRGIIMMLHDVNVADESDELFPKFACHVCAGKFGRDGDGEEDHLFNRVESAHVAMAADPEGIKKLAREHPVADFWAHSSIACQICQDPNYAEFGQEKEVEAMLKQVDRYRSATGAATESPNSVGQRNTSQVMKTMQLRLATLKSRTAVHRVAVVVDVLRALRTDGAVEIVATLEGFGMTFPNLKDRRHVAQQNDDTEKEARG